MPVKKMPNFGGMGNLSNMVRQAQKMQEEMAKLQEELAQKTVEASAGGGVVKVVANGAKQIVSVTIDPSAVDPDDVEMLQDLILTATNQALKQADEMVSGEMAKLTRGFNIPGLF